MNQNFSGDNIHCFETSYLTLHTSISELEVKVEADPGRRDQLNSSSHLVRVFESDRFTLHSPDVVSYTHCGQVPHVTADLCSSDVNGGSYHNSLTLLT